MANDIACTHKGSCVRFNALMAISGVLFCFDIVPVSVLYYQHYCTSVESMRQLKEMKSQVTGARKSTDLAGNKHISGRS